ncbi:pinensin family lanthipeptide [Luteibaculum oceani]|uniref:Uncharacterized protein n=1 Tax=Luteibaculum oceani TaxID=1294296 RepID=A0A5C6VKJ6_9FLAO|nr:pinensin family lanthipeptide [Luteibaculum oceani]TXC85231.1 hypothetical protein FRX97_01000 [Luteibaculum oceani]
MKKKVTLKEIEVKSFVTSIESSKDNIKGGGKIPTLDGCFTGNYPTFNNCTGTISIQTGS